MPDSPSLTIQSHSGPYTVEFLSAPDWSPVLSPDCFFVIDSKVAELHFSSMEPLLLSGRALILEALEENKDLARIPFYIEKLVSLGLKRNHRLVAIGGGIVQDIVCFISSCVFRGIQWSFFPTTLLAQADSCIGSKSSINVGSIKNLVGNFYPPSRVWVCSSFLETLSRDEIHSGIGEMLKVHLIDGWKSFERIEKDFLNLPESKEILQHYICESLRIKQRIIELDEFDRNERLVMNYGHTFGHAIESATRYAIPHGIAVTMGMDLANFYASELGRIPEEKWRAISGVLRGNAGRFMNHPIPEPEFFSAISKDKKNRDRQIALILPKNEGGVERVFVPNDETFQSRCRNYFSQMRNS